MPKLEELIELAAKPRQGRWFDALALTTAPDDRADTSKLWISIAAPGDPGTRRAARALAVDLLVGVADEEERDAIARSISVASLIVGWENLIETDDEPIEHSDMRAFELVHTDWPEFARDVQDMANYAALIASRSEAASEGNSSDGSDGNSS